MNQPLICAPDASRVCTSGLVRRMAARTLAPVTWLVAIITNLLDWMERDRQRRLLGQLNAHMLKDIGLSRADVDFEMRKRPWEP